jgi:hypothetical protein
MFRAKHWLFVITIQSLTIPTLCLAQVNTATIYGTVTYAYGAAVPAATVTATNEQTGANRTTRTIRTYGR